MSHNIHAGRFTFLFSRLKDDDESITPKLTAREKQHAWIAIAHELSFHQYSELIRHVSDLMELRGSSSSHQNLIDNNAGIEVIEMLVHIPKEEAVLLVKQLVTEFSTTEKISRYFQNANVQAFRFVAALRLGLEYKKEMTIPEINDALRKKQQKRVEEIEKLKARNVQRKKWLIVLLVIGVILNIFVILSG